MKAIRAKCMGKLGISGNEQWDLGPAARRRQRNGQTVAVWSLVMSKNDRSVGGHAGNDGYRIGHPAFIRHDEDCRQVCRSRGSFEAPGKVCYAAHCSFSSNRPEL
jgi:hypothetical protein